MFVGIDKVGKVSGIEQLELIREIVAGSVLFFQEIVTIQEQWPLVRPGLTGVAVSGKSGVRHACHIGFARCGGGAPPPAHRFSSRYRPIALVFRFQHVCLFRLADFPCSRDSRACENSM